MSGPRPVSSTPSTTQDWPSVVASSTVPQADLDLHDGIRFERARARREWRAAAAGSAHARRQVADPAEPAGQDPGRQEPQRPRDDQAAEHLERRLREDEPETDADQDQRPERPPSIEHGRVEDAGLDRQWHSASHDEEHAPAREVPVDTHRGTIPCRPGTWRPP